ncbi:MAG: TadE/TadG family type IV pilus assembly protein [Rhodopirellula sp. JB044]|uniref:TadE/TadG family type IV pilus assembly protein n=1 Tax=Rhodopirellula sp. JB044 TaxID=3342844 RepID=UPI00370A1C82
MCNFTNWGRSFRRAGRRKPNDRRGAAAVEFAVVAPIMILFMFGTVEIGRLMMIKNAATHASREGARIAVTPAATAGEVEQRVMDEMQAYTDIGVDVTITPNQLTMAEPGDMVVVRVDVDAASIRWMTSIVDLPITTITSETTMRRESTN